MTRSSLRRTMRVSYVVLALVLVVSLAAKLADWLPGVSGTAAVALAKDIYDYLKDMALVFVTVVATFMAGVYQRRQSFIAALKEEWRDIIKAKSALVAYTQLDRPGRQDYMTAFLAISETIDNMRTVYRNVGETGELIGLYPFAPLHDMRRALQALDPAKSAGLDEDQRRLARDAILQSFYALRECFLEELDLDEPDRPLLAMGVRRRKRSGAPDSARTLQTEERRDTDLMAPPDPRIDAFLRALYDKEQSTAKPWRPAPGNGVSRNDGPASSGPLS